MKWENEEINISAISFYKNQENNRPKKDYQFRIFTYQSISSITETSPYSFVNFRKLSLYNCFMPI